MFIFIAIIYISYIYTLIFKFYVSLQTGIANKNPKSGPTYICLPSTSQQSLSTTESQMCAQLQKEFNFQVTQNKKRRIDTINAQINNRETTIQHSIHSKQQKRKENSMSITCQAKKGSRNKTTEMKLKNLNKLRQGKNRSKITEEETTEQKEINKKQHRERKSKMTEEEKS